MPNSVQPHIDPERENALLQALPYATRVIAEFDRLDEDVRVLAYYIVAAHSGFTRESRVRSVRARASRVNVPKKAPEKATPPAWGKRPKGQGPKKPAQVLRHLKTNKSATVADLAQAIFGDSSTNSKARISNILSRLKKAEKVKRHSTSGKMGRWSLA